MVKVISCKITGSELCSDSWENISENYENVPEGIYVAQSNMIVEGQISVYSGNAFGGDDDEEDPDVVKVNDIVSKFALEKVELSKIDFKAMFTGHIISVMKHMKLKKAAKESEEGMEALNLFQNKAKNALKFYLKNFKDCDIYMNEEQDTNGAYVVGWWNPNATVVDAPQMCFWLDGCDFRKL